MFSLKQVSDKHKRAKLESKNNWIVFLFRSHSVTILETRCSLQIAAKFNLNPDIAAVGLAID